MRIESLHIYPVKSCRGLSVSALELDSRGPVGDRRWMVVDAAGHFVTQREEPRLNRVTVDPRAGGWALAAEGLGVTIREREATVPRTVVVWGDRVVAREHAAGSRFFSDVLGRELALVAFGPEADRRAGSSAPDASVAFADAYPLLVVGRASLEELAGRLGEPIPSRRFRPNVVVAGGAPYAEDGWDRVRLGSVPMRMVKRCERCSMVTVDDTGNKGREPLTTLATYRRDGGKVYFGVNLAHDGLGTLRVGEPVTPVAAAQA